LVDVRLQQPIVIVEHDPAWPDRYDVVAEQIRAALGDAVLALDHVGSTAVPGLAAKSVIDVDLAVVDSADEAIYVPALEASGFLLASASPTGTSTAPSRATTRGSTCTCSRPTAPRRSGT